MKKITITFVTVIALISLAACTQNKTDSSKVSEKTSMSSEKDQMIDETSTMKDQEKSQSIFTAILVEDAKKMIQ